MLLLVTFVTFGNVYTTCLHQESKNQLQKLTLEKMAVPQVCIYFKYGHCKYKNNCRNRHIEDLCDTDNCDGRACEKRHPKSCRYFEIFGRCKYNPCSFSHVAGSLVHDKLGKLESLIDVMKHKIDVLK